jgi:hypothetical protein
MGKVNQKGSIVILTESLQDYFREALTEALARRSALLSHEVQAYVVRMLLDFSRSERAFSGVDKGEEPTFAILLARALESEPPEALKLYKQVGDLTLYQLGFFKEFASQKLANESYYFSVGESAYSSASNLARPHGIAGALIYGELAERFNDLVYVFNEMSLYGERSQGPGDIPTERILSLIEHYQRTNSPQIREILIRQGVQLGNEQKKS